MQGGLQLLAAMSLSDDEDEVKKEGEKEKKPLKAKAKGKATPKEKAAAEDKKEVKQKEKAKAKAKGGTRKRPAPSTRIPIYKCYHKNLKKYCFKIDEKIAEIAAPCTHHAPCSPCTHWLTRANLQAVQELAYDALAGAYPALLNLRARNTVFLKEALACQGGAKGFSRSGFCKSDTRVLWRLFNVPSSALDFIHGLKVFSWAIAIRP